MAGLQPTDFEALDAIYPLPLDDLHRQWALSRTRTALPEADWAVHTLHGWHLAAHPETHVCALQADDGAPLGWVLEPLFYSAGQRFERPDEVLRLPVSSADASEAELERALYGRDASGRSDGSGLGGMWIAIVLAPVPRLYLGPIHSVVYDPEKRIVAPTHNLLGPVTRDLELSRAFDPLATFRYYSFGLTAFRGVRRLLPNHYLDLERFVPVRHWPKAPLPRFQDGREGAAAIVEHGQRILEGMAETVERFAVPLSAGNDSRAVLSLLRRVCEAGRTPVELFTSVGVDFGKRIDVQGARRLAALSGLAHEVQPRPPHVAVPAEAVMRNFARIGEAKATPILSAPGTLKRAEDSGSKLTVAGMGGETARATFWKKGAPEVVTSEDLLQRTGAPVMPVTIAAAQEWLDGLPDFIRASPADTLDLAYIEQRLGCWEANSRYLFPSPLGRRPQVISPMVSGFSLETMLRLPHAYRQSGVFQRDMVACGWPALLEVPFNRATGALRVEHKLRRMVTRARAVVGRNRR